MSADEAIKQYQKAHAEYVAADERLAKANVEQINARDGYYVALHAMEAARHRLTEAVVATPPEAK